eukprot:TRINITY_DN4176_c0_g2_i4.p1 TRINITY_DN4176_c0_g2~~TRINITY_DN4176_c0_g2_i4.p1  ORF type:complete len:469 (-),score=107.60 TRINITY_DN4176_c0_g2_i4:27-1433(-)
MADRTHSVLADNYLILRTLGSGFSCKVKLAINAQQNKHYAVKILKNNKDHFAEKEIQVARGLQHENIVTVYEILQNVRYVKKNGQVKTVTALILELAEMGELFDVIKTSGRLEENYARYYFHSLIASLEYLHKMKIAHRDLKLENLLLDSKFRLKITDFGLASAFQPGVFLKSHVGTRMYMPPEIESGEAYHGPSADLFSAGVCLFTMCCGFSPFSRAVLADPLYMNIATQKYDVYWSSINSRRPSLSPEFQDLINFMLALDPAQRLSIAEIKEHPWYKGELPRVEEIFTFMRKTTDLIENEKEFERQRRQREAQAQAQTQPTTRRPAGGILQGYRLPKTRSGDYGKTDAEMITEEFNVISPTRKEQPYESCDAIRNADIFFADDSIGALITVLAELKHKGYEITLSETHFKLNAQKFDAETGDNLIIRAKIFAGKEETSAIRFERLEGDPLRFYADIQSITTEITKV